MHDYSYYPEVRHTVAECCEEEEHSYLENRVAYEGEKRGDILSCQDAEQPAENAAQNDGDKCECDIASCGGIDKEGEHFHWVGESCNCEQGGDDDCTEGDEAFFPYSEFAVELFDEF